MRPLWLRILLTLAARVVAMEALSRVERARATGDMSVGLALFMRYYALWGVADGVWLVASEAAWLLTGRNPRWSRARFAVGRRRRLAEVP